MSRDPLDLDSTASPVDRLREVLRRTTRDVPYYASLRAPSRFATDAQVVRSLRQFPLLEKEDLRQHLPSFVSRRYEAGALLTVHSSGSSGTPLSLVRHRDENRVEREFIAAAWEPLGVSPHDSTVILRANAAPEGKSHIYPGAGNDTWVHLADLSDANLDRTIAAIHDIAPRFLRGHGSLVGALLGRAHRTGVSFAGLKGAAYSSDDMLPSERTTIRHDLGLGLIALWGLTERAGMAVTPPDADFFHVVPHYGFIELIRPDGTVITTPGEYGEIVGTSLFPRATSMVRYRTGDLAAWEKPGILSSIVGRGLRTLISRDGHPFVVPVSVQDSVLQSMPSGTNVQFAQTSPGEVTLRVDRGWSSELDPMLEQFRELERFCDLTYEWNATIETAPSGKRLLIIASTQSVPAAPPAG